MNGSSFSTAEVARMLGVSIPTVQRWVDLGVLKAWKTLGGHRRLDADSVQAFLKEHGLRANGANPAQFSDDTLLVLIVEDNLDDRELLVTLAEETLPAARVQTAANGFEALIAIGRGVPRLLISDIMMPHMNGLEMLRHLQATPDHRPSVTVAVSAESLKGLAHLGALPRGVHFIQKPIDPAHFATLVREALAEAGIQVAGDAAV